jgi:hypothetical protein
LGLFFRIAFRVNARFSAGSRRDTRRETLRARPYPAKFSWKPVPGQELFAFNKI